MNIASEEATNALSQQAENKITQSHQDMAALAIVSVSFIAAIPAANEVIKMYSSTRTSSPHKDGNSNNLQSGYSGQPANDHY